MAGQRSRSAGAVQVLSEQAGRHRELGQLTPADQRAIPGHTMSGFAVTQGGRLAGELGVTGDWLGTGRLVVSSCSHSYQLSFLDFIFFSLFDVVFLPQQNI